jgi:hypothetical protein
MNNRNARAFVQLVSPLPPTDTVVNLVCDNGTRDVPRRNNIVKSFKIYYIQLYYYLLDGVVCIGPPQAVVDIIIIIIIAPTNKCTLSYYRTLTYTREPVELWIDGSLYGEGLEIADKARLKMK